MKFYNSIAEHYDQIFPFRKAQLNFVTQKIEDVSEKSVLDVGCGIGSLSAELAKHFKEVTAIDLDEAMLQIAQEKNIFGVSFRRKDMLNIYNEFGENAFDLVICFGNTLVHLDGPDEILDFLKQCRKVLKDNGRLMLQIINYDRILDNDIKGLPPIENENIKFVRNYHHKAEQNIIDFTTSLTIKGSGEKIKNTIQLYPILNIELIELLYEAGFTEIFFFKNFNRDVITDDSIPLVVEAR